MLRSGEPLVFVCRTSTKVASSGDRRLRLSAFSKLGPAGSRPGKTGENAIVLHCTLTVTKGLRRVDPFAILL